MSLTLKERDDEGSIYLAPYGEEVRIEDAGWRDLNLIEIWDGFTAEFQAQTTYGFRFHTKESTFRDYLNLLGYFTVNPGELWFCQSCDEPTQNTTATLAGYRICDSCRDEDFSFCESCDGWYGDDDADAHQHPTYRGCCESPQTVFSIRNDGEEPLANDTRATVTLPSGLVSREGVDGIREYLRTTANQLYGDGKDDAQRSYASDLHNLSYCLTELGDEWQNKQGNYAKRLSRYAYTTYKLKLSPEIMSQVGVIARDHSNAVDVEIEVTRRLNEPAWFFYHEDSCWWGGYSESRCTFKTNGGFGVRTFAGEQITGRAWVIPVRVDDSRPTRKFTPTFDTMTPDAFIVFNGYGELSGYACARIMSHMSGFTYKKIGFDCSHTYVNGNNGYLVAPEVITRKFDEVYLSVAQHSNLFETEKNMSKELSDVA